MIVSNMVRERRGRERMPAAQTVLSTRLVLVLGDGVVVVLAAVVWLGLVCA
jgi:hypothetical protein